MKYAIINQGEDISVTRKELEKRYSSLEELRDLNAAECKIYKRGQVWVIEYDGTVIYDEVHSEQYPFFENAFHYMNVEQNERWKTVRNLISLRQAIREDAVNYRGFSDMLKHPLTERLFNEFMKMSRSADLVHHGEHTF
ncbi:MAG: hypothetical protein ACR2KZ_04495 [Segetibacter sp.]